MKVMTPVLPYSAGQATAAKPPIRVAIDHVVVGASRCVSSLPGQDLEAVTVKRLGSGIRRLSACILPLRFAAATRADRTLRPIQIGRPVQTILPGELINFLAYSSTSLPSRSDNAYSRCAATNARKDSRTFNSSAPMRRLKFRVQPRRQSARFLRFRRLGTGNGHRIGAGIQFTAVRSGQDYLVSLRQRVEKRFSSDAASTGSGLIR